MEETLDEILGLTYMEFTYEQVKAFADKACPFHLECKDCQVIVFCLDKGRDNLDTITLWAREVLERYGKKELYIFGKTSI